MSEKGDDMIDGAPPESWLAEQRPTMARIAVSSGRQPRDPRERPPRRTMATALRTVAARLLGALAAPAPPGARALPPDAPRERLNAWG